jgi:hypothetical protein
MNHEARQTLRIEAHAKQIAAATERMNAQLATPIDRVTDNLKRDFAALFPKTDAKVEKAIREANSLGSDLVGSLTRLSGEIADEIADTKRRLQRLVTAAHSNGLGLEEAGQGYRDIDNILDELCSELTGPIDREIERRRAFP